MDHHKMAVALQEAHDAGMKAAADAASKAAAAASMAAQNADSKPKEGARRRSLSPASRRLTEHGGGGYGGLGTGEEDAVVRIRGLPFSASLADIAAFFDGFGVAVDPGKSVHVSGRGRWGVFLDAKAGSSDAWQLYIVKTAEAARAVENETLCFPKLTRGCDAYVFSENGSVRLDFQGTVQASKCRCPANSSCGYFGY